ncbi:MAG: hypothetical protein IJU45_04760, partial [Clostridia bacterium]|nr:hypothetical protein [Clostridia bacterium]
MKINFCEIYLKHSCSVSQKAAELFKDEIELRANSSAESSGKFCFEFIINSAGDDESFSIQKNGSGFVFKAHRLRGLIYAYSLFLRKAETRSDSFVLSEDISGVYSPEKKIRGHQTGYRAINNTYDMWNERQFRRYFLDLMMFGMNIYEGIPGGKDEVAFPMKMTGDEMLIKTAEICDELDLDVSVWAPTGYNESDEQVIERIHGTYFKMKKLDVLFIPGSDPGDLEPTDLFLRCKLIKNEFEKYNKKISIWVSAQAPHDQSDWGAKFLEQLGFAGGFIDGVIYGPNHAMSLDSLYKAVGGRFPLRFYPDVTHSVRCEYPVHYDKNDWHCAFASCFGRESVDPRPQEYASLYENTKNYFCGSVSYSDGIHDDVNKVVFSALDFDSSQPVETVLNDYARAFFYKADSKKIADLVLSLEKNWEGSPAENEEIETTYSKAAGHIKTYPFLENNFRFIMLLFRAECDLLIKKRFDFERELLKKAEEKIFANDLGSAKEILLKDFKSDYKNLRSKIDRHAELLNKLIGMQLDVERFGGTNWERGCTLETIDRPITDRQYILNKIKSGSTAEDLKEIISRCRVENDEIYFSFCTDGMGKIDRQSDDFYLDFSGDRPA